MTFSFYFTQGLDTFGAIGGAIVIIGFFLILIYFLSGFKIVKEWERAPVLRLGRYRGLRGPGWFWILPGIDKIPQVISTRIRTYSFRSEQSLTRDNVPVSIDAVLFFRVIDVEKTILEVEHYNAATQWIADRQRGSSSVKLSFSLFRSRN